MSTVLPAPDRKIEFRPLLPGDDASTFRALNEEWINRHFRLEAKDIETLNDPETSILSKGGHISILYVNAEAAGCVALIPMDPQAERIYELSKMAVAPHLRGQGLGRSLLLHAIAEARRLRARRLFLASSTKLPDAIHLYESAGFRHVPPGALPPVPYTRADVFMELEL